MRVSLISLALCLLPWSLHAASPVAASVAPAPVVQSTAAGKGEVTVAESSATQEAVNREAGASEDPMSEQEVGTLEEPEQPVIKKYDFSLYGNYRLRFRSVDGSDYALSDGGSRVGADANYQLLPKLKAFGRVELGFNLLNELNFLINSKDSPPEGESGNSFFKRLLYVGLESPGYFLTYGKSWSTYYKVAGFTDRFAGTGGDASGTYNAGTDGGATGTGRAQSVIQTRLQIGKLSKVLGIKPFNLNLQVQQGEPIPLVDGEHYGTAVGLSAIHHIRPEFSLGIAYNIAEIKDLDDPDIRLAGLDGNAQAILVGTRQFGEKWYLGTVVSRLLNHETTDQGTYFDGWGWEVYGQYQLREKIWLTGGWNYLRPDSDRLSGDYEVKYGVIGLRYSQDGFQKMIYANAQFDHGRLTDGERLGNVYTIGMRWNLGEIGHWMLGKYRQLSSR
ncbi:MAG: porin [Gammaproteobacteria bacterium]|jgi:predicted porin|nr:porin [Gammaproteobacteria bacterium]